tara:strand:+ start:436 stop:585 length:150 start_codon:yes stop_codon:yes gene_type:complete
MESDDGTPGYDYLLINTEDKEKAHAKYFGKQGQLGVVRAGKIEIQPLIC